MCTCYKFQLSFVYKNEKFKSIWISHLYGSPGYVLILLIIIGISTIITIIVLSKVINKCTKVMQYLDTGCSSNYMCDQSKYLSCVNKTCKCDTLKVFDIVSQTCRFNYLGCYYDLNYGTTYYFVSWMNQVPYFIVTCINTCQLRMFNYTYFYAINGLSRCNCVNSVNFSLPGSCEMICFGQNADKYSCGSLFATGVYSTYHYRSVYLNYGY